MSKVYTFIELLSEIKEGKIDSGTKFKEINLQDYKIEVVDGFIYDLNGFGISLNVNDIFEMEFELIEEDTIDSIEEYKTTYTERCIDREVREKLNEIIRRLNQLNNI